MSVLPFEAGREGEPLSEREQRLVKRLFSDPTQIPQDWLPWLKARLEADPPVFSTADIFQLDSKLGAITGTIEGAAPHIDVVPPTGPVDGDRWIWPAPAGQSVLWEFVRNGSSWFFVGGAPIRAEVGTSEATASGTFVELATQVRLLLDRIGVYRVDIAAQVSQASASQSRGQVAVYNESAGTDTGSAYVSATSANDALYGGASFGFLQTAATGVTVGLRFRSLDSLSTVFAQKKLHITPVWVS